MRKKLERKCKQSAGSWTIVHGGQKIESAQKIHAGRG